MTRRSRCVRWMARVGPSYSARDRLICEHPAPAARGVLAQVDAVEVAVANLVLTRRHLAPRARAAAGRFLVFGHDFPQWRGGILGNSAAGFFAGVRDGAEAAREATSAESGIFLPSA